MKPNETKSYLSPLPKEKKKTSNNKHEQTNFVFCWPINPEHRDCPGVYPVALYWENKTKLAFPVPEVSVVNNSLIRSGALFLLPSQC